MRILKKSISVILTLTMIIGIFAAAPFTVSASDNVAYYISKHGAVVYYSDFWSAWNMAELKNILCARTSTAKAIRHCSESQAIHARERPQICPQSASWIHTTHTAD